MCGADNDNRVGIVTTPFFTVSASSIFHFMLRYLVIFVMCGRVIILVGLSSVNSRQLPRYLPFDIISCMHICIPFDDIVKVSSLLRAVRHLQNVVNNVV